MKYSECNTGRVLIARFDNGEEFVSGIANLLNKEKINSGIMFFLGALKSGEVVAGPLNEDLPPVSNWQCFNSPHEIVGIGTIFPKEGEPFIHMHASLGRGKENMTGCIRKIAEVYIVVEVIIYEFIHTEAKRIFDEKSGLSILEP